MNSRHNASRRHRTAPAAARIISPGTAHTHILAIPMRRASTTVALGSEKISIMLCRRCKSAAGRAGGHQALAAAGARKTETSPVPAGRTAADSPR